MASSKPPGFSFLQPPLRQAQHAPSVSPHPLKGPERLVGVGFRCWLAGCRTGDITNWEYAFNMYARELGACGARAAVGELSCWVRKIRDVAGRDISTLPTDCPGFCRDECVAISMIAASQHKVCPAMRACAFALIGCSNVDAIMTHTDSFALTLAALDQRLSPSSIGMAANLVPPTSMAQH
jgi:hypothetical protein